MPPQDNGCGARKWPTTAIDCLSGCVVSLEGMRSKEKKNEDVDISRSSSLHPLLSLSPKHPTLTAASPAKP
jgi:hypothetical protein